MKCYNFLLVNEAECYWLSQIFYSCDKRLLQTETSSVY